MGKKAKSSVGIAKAANRKIDKATLPPPPPPPHEEVGSSKPLDEPSLPGTGYKVLGEEGFDDGGVADLSLLIDLEDSVQRRRRGDSDYYTAFKADLLPRATRGPMAKMSRREQKISLAQLLFSEDDDCDDKGPSEVWMDTVDGEEDLATMEFRANRLSQAKAALRLSLLLREPACASLSLSEICKRTLSFKGKEGAEVALRCAKKAVEIAGDGFWDSDDVAMEGEENPKPDPKYEKNATSPGLAHPTSLKLLPIRMSELCLRSALLQQGNALTALGREEDARASYESVFPFLEKEPRCARVDWERHSLYVNIGNTFSRTGDFAKADEQYNLAEDLGKGHLEEEAGSTSDGNGMVNIARRARAFALKKAGREDEAKALLKEVIEAQIKQNLEAEEKKKQEAEATEAKAKEEAAEAKAKEEATK